MTFWPFLHFFSFLVYLVFAAVIIIKNPKSRLNQLLALSQIVMAIWSFGKIFVHSPYSTREAANFFDNISSIGWITFIPIFFLWSALFAGYIKIFRWRLHYLLGILSGLFFIQQLNGKILVDHIKTPYGWGNVWSHSLWTGLFTGYYIALSLIAIAMLIIFHIFTTDLVKKKQSRIIVAGMVIPFTLGFLTDTILPFKGITYIPDLGNVFSLLLPVLSVYAMVKYKFLTITPAIAADNIIAHITDLFVLMDTKGNIVEVNQSVLNLLGYSREEVANKPADFLLEDKASARQLLMDMANVDSLADREAFLISKNGREIPMLFSVFKLKDENGVQAGFVSIGKNLSEIKKTQDALWQAKEQLEEEVEARSAQLRMTSAQLSRSYEILKLIMDRVPVGIFLLNISGVVEYVNDAMVFIAGMPRDQLVGENIYDIEAYKEIGLHHNVRHAAETQVPFFINKAKIVAYYAKKPMYVNYMGIFVEDNTGPKVVVFVEDITDVK